MDMELLLGTGRCYRRNVCFYCVYCNWQANDYMRYTESYMITKKRFVAILAILAVIVVLGVGVAAMVRRGTPSKNEPTDTSNHSSVVTHKSPTSIRLIATGDWIAHDSVNTAAKQADGTYDYMPMVNDFKPIFSSADIRFCNDPILNGGESLGVHGYPKFNSPTEFVTDMGKLGCNLANTASNHSFDYTQANIDNSVDAWSSVPSMLAVAGENKNQAQHDTVHYFTMDGIKFAFLAYATYINTDAPVQNSYGVNVFSRAFATSQIKEAKANGAQFIIASMRWGTEYATVVNAEQQSDAQFLADQGVNLVLGHGSHELQPVTQLIGSGGNKTTVWYSLGNFINTQEPAETLFNGIAVITIDIKSRAITSQSYLPIYMHYEWTPSQKAADDIAARHTLHLYLLEDATQAMINAQQLNTTIAAQKQRMTRTLDSMGQKIPLVTSQQL